MQPDKIHFHMIIFKRFAKSNPLTSMSICALEVPFIVLSCVFYDNTFALISISMLFVLVYMFIYKRLVYFAWKSKK